MNSPFPFRPLLLLPAALPLFLALSSCSKETDSTPPPPVVTVVPIQEREVQDFVTFTGRTEAVQTVEIRARVSGYLVETKFKDGQDVKKGDPLFLIDPRPYQADLDRAQAEFDRAQADLQLAAIEFNRTRELRLKNAVSAQDFDSKSAAYLKAQGGLASAKAALDTAKLNLEFTNITSPIDGQTSKASVTPGNLVTPDMKEPLTVIVSTNTIYAYADIDERQLLRYIRLENSKHTEGNVPETVPEQSTEAKPATPISLQLADEKGFPHEGVIDFADNRLNNATGTIAIRGVFPDKSHLIGPGMFVRLRFAGGPKYKTLLVPQESIGTDQGQKFIFVIRPDGTADYRRVEPGAIQDDGWRAVTGQIQAGENVVVDGLMKARTGEKVTAKPWTGNALPVSAPVPVAAPAVEATK
ncbi:MAG: efflux RND transporter periplasmic adaptor subunit [Terrimicrobiaceae bacterium]